MKYKTTNVLRLANTVRQNIQIEKLVNSNNLLITFSGGQDSAFCLLVLYLLNNQIRRQWNCKKVLDLSDHYNKNKTLTKQSCNPIFSLNGLTGTKFRSRHGKQSIFYLSQTRALFLQNLLQKLHKNEICVTSFCEVFVKALLYRFAKRVKKRSFLKSLIPVTSLYRNSNTNPLTSIDGLRKQGFAQSFSKGKNVKENILNYNQITEFIEKYTLLWCNHFWQKDTFFTMEHVFKLSFSKNYTMHSFAPIKKILSEQNARHWRHKVMQRLSLFLLERDYHFVELYFNSVFITTPFLLTRSRKENYGVHKTLFCNKHKKQIETLSKNKISLKQTKIPPGFYQNFASVLYLSLTKQSFVKEQLCVQGHNKSDRAEAILFNLMRGTGMNGLSTLQWKHTFFSLSNSNSKFYPLFSDFFKEIQIIYLNSLFINFSLQKETIKTNRSLFAVNQNLVLPEILFDQDLIRKPNKIKVARFLYKQHVFTLSLTKQQTNFTFLKSNFEQGFGVGNKPSETFFMPSQKKAKPFYYQLKSVYKKKFACL